MQRTSPCRQMYNKYSDFGRHRRGCGSCCGPIHLQSTSHNFTKLLSPVSSHFIRLLQSFSPLGSYTSWASKYCVIFSHSLFNFPTGNRKTMGTPTS